MTNFPGGSIECRTRDNSGLPCEQKLSVNAKSLITLQSGNSAGSPFGHGGDFFMDAPNHKGDELPKGPEVFIGFGASLKEM